jgi:hypothetical protein
MPEGKVNDEADRHEYRKALASFPPDIYETLGVHRQGKEGVAGLGGA